MAETWTKEQIEAAIDAEERKYPNIPRGLARAVAMQESYLNPNASGDNGRSLGLFQLQPAAATDAGISPALRHVPALNIQGGVKYLSQKLGQSKGDIDQALSRYNRGTPDYRGIGDPDYVQNVKRFYQPSEEKPGLLARAWKAVGPRSAEAAEPQKKWYDFVPEKPPEVTAPADRPEASPAAPATGDTGKWYDFVPETPPAAPTAPPAIQQPAGQPPTSSAPPAPAQRPQPPTARSTAEQDAAYRRSVGQEEPPASVPPQEPQSTVTPQAASTPESRARAQMLKPYMVPELDPAAISKEWEEAGAASTDTAWWSGADPSSPRHQEWLKSSPMPSTREVAREVAATGIEGAYGVAGTMAGTAIGGPPGGVAGGIAGQSFGRRLTNYAGLRSQEPYIATGFGLNLYPSDVANAGFGLLTGGPALFKHALSKTTAGKAIVQAEMSTKEAYQAWQIEKQRLQAAQKTGQQADMNIALKDHATAEANYKRLVQQRDDTIAANKAEYDKAVQDYGEGARQTHIEDLTEQQKYLTELADAQKREYGTARVETERELLASREKGYNESLEKIQKKLGTYEEGVAKEQTAWESQAAAIPEAKAIPKPYAEGTPAHVLYKDMRDRYSNEPVTPDTGKADLKDMRANRPKTFAGTPSPFEGEVETIAQAFEKSTGPLNVATVHDQLKKLGPLTRHSDPKIRGDAKQLAGVLMDVLETAPEAAGAIKVANQRWKREEALKDINEWLEPNRGVMSTKRGQDTINTNALLNKFQRERSTSKLFREAFTDEEAATMEDSMRVLAAKTLPPPGPQGPVKPTPYLLPAASIPPKPTGEALPGAAPQTFSKGLAEAPTPTELPARPEMKPAPPEVPPIYPEFPDPGQRAGLTVPLVPPAKIPPEPASTSMWYPEPLKKGEWIRKRPPQEGQWTREQWETYAKEKLDKKPGLSLGGTLSGAGGMAFALQRMGFSPQAADASLWGVAGAGVAGALKAKGEWLLSKALLKDRYRPLLQEAMMDNNQMNPYFYNAMLAALTPEDKKEYEREVRSTAQQKARR